VTGEPPQPADLDRNRLRARRLGIDTQQEAVIFMRKDCHVCRAEGFTAHARVLVSNGHSAVIATLFQVTSDILDDGEAGLSEPAWRRLGLDDGAVVHVSHPAPVTSMSLVRGKIYGERLGQAALKRIVTDMVAGRYSDIDLSAFITACSALPLDLSETAALTRAMAEAGDRLDWGRHPIADKHCVGGLPGNRTTPIVVAIVAACGVTIPKTSSRAITSPAGTADTMETLAPVDLDLAAMRRVVEQEGGCVVWGGAMRLSPVDDVLIRVERSLDIDSEGQLVASVLSKKIAAGSSHVILDLPVGPTAKVRSAEAAAALAAQLEAVAAQFGLRTRVVTSDGSQPVGRRIGPALEAVDVLEVLQGRRDEPDDLRDCSLALAGALLELVDAVPEGEGVARAEAVLSDGTAWRKFQGICEAQGGLREPPRPRHHSVIEAARSGRLQTIDNRRIARVAKLAGAPEAKASGVELHVRLGEAVRAGQPLYTIHAEAPGELAYAREYARANPDIFGIGEEADGTGL
jgi:thymidine phosphorylase